MRIVACTVVALLLPTVASAQGFTPFPERSDLTLAVSFCTGVVEGELVLFQSQGLAPMWEGAPMTPEEYRANAMPRCVIDVLSTDPPPFQYHA